MEVKNQFNKTDSEFERNMIISSSWANVEVWFFSHILKALLETKKL